MAKEKAKRKTMTTANKFAIRFGKIKKLWRADQTGADTQGLFDTLYDDAAEQAESMDRVGDSDTTLYIFEDGSIFSTSGHGYADEDSYNKWA
jgi:hypothetical protein